MEIHEVTALEYSRIFHNPYHTFISSSFTEINKRKAEKVLYLFFVEKKIRLGLTVGIRENSVLSPFSAPFGGFSFLTDDIKIRFIDDAIDVLLQWVERNRYETIHITLPPSIYHNSFIAKQTNSLFRKGFIISKIDLNYSFELRDFTSEYLQRIWYNARKNLRNALNNNLVLSLCATTEEYKLAYTIIEQNRKARGFPLRMTWKEVESTMSIITMDGFIVFNTERLAIASAIVYHISATIVQVVYWGDLPGFSGSKTMNFLSYKIFEHYKNLGVKTVDIGPSTENSIPNFGLCEFKESIGCSIDHKFSLLKKLSY